MSADLNATLQSFDLSHGFLPPADSGSCEFKMFVLPRGVVTPTGVTQFVTSSGPPVTMQLDMAIVNGRLIHGAGRGDLPSDPRGKEAGEEDCVQLYQLVKSGSTVPHGGSGYWL